MTNIENTENTEERSADNLMGDLFKIKDSLGGIQDYLRNLHAEESTEKGNDDAYADRVLPYEKAIAILSITDLIVKQMSVLNGQLAHDLREPQNNINADLLSVYSRIMLHLKK
jgi:CRISPR/Cas system-associated protein endoribonuclease Cas2